ncbi:T9SS type A sorting domain-containing protein, partial [Runella sp.]|uniref:DUF7619 domain-containing protein n=1 Tax=Runella sp. TaxID=1960881 RepID=UPI003018A3D4
ISGKVYSDQNNNGIRDNNEPSIPNIFIHSQSNGLFSQSDSTGVYTIFADQSDTIKVIAPTPYAVVHPDHYIKSQATNGNYDFGIYYTPNINDLRISTILDQPLVPGFSRTLFITCTNVGTNTIAPKIVVHIPQPLLINASVPLADLVSGDSLIWQLSDLETQQTAKLSVNLTVPSFVNPSESFSFESIVYPIQGDQAPLDNHYINTEKVVSSFDPNDKSVQPQDYFSPTQLANGERLYYTIRFQNTGNYQATFVRILDSLQENLDPATMRLETFSHPVKWFWRGKNVLEFMFENIHLPDATSNEDASHGFVTFSIRPKSDLIIGTSIANRAFIYFDYNTPIETNKVVNKFDFPSAVWEKNTPELQIYPNPTTGKFLVQNKDNQDITLLIYDASGRPICTKNSSGANIPMDISGMPTGSFWVFALDKNKRLIGKSVLVKGDK